MNEVILKKELEKKLIQRGMLKTTGGVVLQAPKRKYRSLGEEILWMLNESQTRLTANDFCNYLSIDYNTIRKVLVKLNESSLKLINKETIKRQNYYSCNYKFKSDKDIEITYDLIRKHIA